MRFTYCPKCSHALIKSDLEGVSRVHCPHPGCGFVHYDNPTPVVAAIVQRDDDVILIQNKGWPGTWFGLVSGFLERKEDPAIGVLREVDEELGFKAELQSLVGVYGFPEMNQVIMVYHVVVSGDVVMGDELEAFKVVPISKLIPWKMGTGQAVKDWLAAR
jgi:NAD+ diphosphatase